MGQPFPAVTGSAHRASTCSAVNELSPADRAQIVSLGLLSPLPRTSFEIRVAGWLGQVVGDQPVRPELDSLAASGLPITCVYGRDDQDSLCRQLPASVAHVVALPGGHDCNDDHAAIVHSWLSGRSVPGAQSTDEQHVGGMVRTLKPARQ